MITLHDDFSPTSSPLDRNLHSKGSLPSGIPTHTTSARISYGGTRGGGDPASRCCALRHHRSSVCPIYPTPEGERRGVKDQWAEGYAVGRIVEVQCASHRGYIVQLFLTSTDLDARVDEWPLLSEKGCCRVDRIQGFDKRNLPYARR